MKQKNGKQAIGIDRGGTHTRIVLCSEAGDIKKRKIAPSGDFSSLPSLIINTMQTWRVSTKTPVLIAAKGVMSDKSKRVFLQKRLQGQINLLGVISDAEAAYFSAHGKTCGQALLIAGTGSVLLLKICDNGFLKIGGTNPPKGDPGSGLWLGEKYLKQYPRKAAALSNAEKAAYAVSVLNKARKGNKEALNLISAAHSELSALIEEAVSGNKMAKISVALAGGLMNNEYFRNKFIRHAREKLAPTKLIFKTLKQPAEQAAAMLAMEINDERNKHSEKSAA